VPTLDTMINLLRETADRPADRPVGLDGQFYTSPDWFELETQSLLHKSWHCVGRFDEVPYPGDFMTAQILDEPVIIVRDDDGKIRALSNVCRHRSMRIAQGKGSVKRFVCPYHAWSYARNGALVRAANMKNADFDPKACKLPEFACEIWQGFIYVNILDNPESVNLHIEQLDELLIPYETEKFRVVHSAFETWNCNWKCLVENFMEGYHLSVVHPETLRGYTPTELCTKGPAGTTFTSYHANYPDDIPLRGKGAPGLDEKQQHRSSLFSRFPLQVVSQSASLLVSLSIMPTAVDRIDVKWTMSVYGDDLDEETINDRIELWTDVNREDREKLEILQQTLKSSKAVAGPLASDEFEGTVRDFHKFLASQLTA